MTRTPSLRIVPFVLVLAAASGARAQDSAPTFDADVAAKIDAVFSDWKGSAPGAALGVYRDGRLVYAHGYGLASLEHQVPNAPSTVFDLGSTSKQFTAACIVLLKLDGKLDFDDPVRKYVLELPEWGDRVTIRQCLHHTSGTRDYTALLSFTGKADQDRTTDDDALRVLAKQRGLCFEPGSKHEYSNTGYFLLSRVVRAVAKKPLSEFARERIFAPLGMAATLILDDCTRVVPHRATGYAPARKTYAVEMSNWEQTGDGAVQTSVEDLAKWVDNFTTGKVGGPEFLKIMSSRGALADGTPLDYGFGRFFGEIDGRSIILHGGAWAGYRAELLRLVDDGLAVAVLANRSDADPTDRARKVAKILLAAGLGRPASDVASPGSRPKRAHRAESAPTSRPAAPKLSAEDLEAYAGEYASDEVDATWTVKAAKTGIRVGIRDDSVLLALSAPDVFTAIGFGSLTFERGADGRPVRFFVRMRSVAGLAFERKPDSRPATR